MGLWDYGTMGLWDYGTMNETNVYHLTVSLEVAF